MTRHQYNLKINRLLDMMVKNVIAMRRLDTHCHKATLLDYLNAQCTLKYLIFDLVGQRDKLDYKHTPEHAKSLMVRQVVQDAYHHYENSRNVYGQIIDQKWRRRQRNKGLFLYSRHGKEE